MALKKNKLPKYVIWSNFQNIDNYFNLPDDIKITPTLLVDLANVFPLKNKNIRFTETPNGKNEVEDKDKIDINSNYLNFVKTHIFNNNKKNKSRRNFISFKQFLELINYPNTNLTPKEFAIQKRVENIKTKVDALAPIIEETYNSDNEFIDSLKPNNRINLLNNLMAYPANIKNYNTNEAEKFIDTAILNRFKIISIIDGDVLGKSLLYEIKKLLEYEKFKFEEKQKYIIKQNEYYYCASKAHAEINSYNFLKFYIKNK